MDVQTHQQDTIQQDVIQAETTVQDKQPVEQENIVQQEQEYVLT